MKKNKSAGMPAAKIAAAILAVLLILLLGGYLWRGLYYGKHFFPGTELNGVDASGLTVDEAEDKVAKEVADYMLTVKTRDGDKYQIIGPDIDYTYVSGTEIADILADQKNMMWLTDGKGTANDLDVSATFSEEKLRTLVSKLDCFSEEKIVKPQDAYLNETEDGYEIVPEVAGNQLDEEAVQKLVRDAVDAGDEELTLPDEVYAEPSVHTDDEQLQKSLSRINAYLDTTINYDVGESGEVLDRKTIRDWITVSEDFQVSFDESKIDGYVQYLASKYNTFGDVRKFKTTQGDVVEIGGGDYGWVINKEKEKEQLLSEIDSGQTINREPVFTQTALVKSETYDLPDTYIEVDYTNQHMYYYKDGKLKLDSDVVTGNISRSNGSPDGIYKIVYKQSPATLVGEGYQSEVQYFMVFAYNVGLHDASWRSEFGGEIYKTSGSHGCVNMPAKNAKKLYGMLESGTPVIAYYREPVTLTAENARISNAYSYKKE